jgi:hypothetical protein
VVIEGPLPSRMTFRLYFKSHRYTHSVKINWNIFVQTQCLQILFNFGSIELCSWLDSIACISLLTDSGRMQCTCSSVHARCNAQLRCFASLFFTIYLKLINLFLYIWLRKKLWLSWSDWRCTLFIVKLWRYAELKLITWTTHVESQFDLLFNWIYAYISKTFSSNLSIC